MIRWLLTALPMMMSLFIRHSLQQQQGCVRNVGFMVSHAQVIYDLNPSYTVDNIPVYYSHDMMQFLYNLTAELQPSSDGTHVGLVKFGNIAYTQWDLNRFTANSLDLMDAINAVRITYDAGLSNMADAFVKMRTDVMSQSGGGSRAGVRNVCVMITVNTADINVTDFLPQANQLKEFCRLIIIGVGPYATDATADAYFQPAVTNSLTDFIKVSTFPQLNDCIATVFNSICSTSDVSTSTTTASTSVNNFVPSTSPSTRPMSPSTTMTTLPADSTTGSITTLHPSGLSGPVVTSISPQYGPLAGGTHLTIYGDRIVYIFTATDVPASSGRRKRQQASWGTQDDAIVQVLIGNVSATVDSRKSISNKLIVMTPALEQIGSYTIYFNLSSGLLFNTGVTFSYRPNPTTSTIAPLDHLTAGGTDVNVTGTDLTSVAAPQISLTIVVTRFDANYSLVRQNSSTTFETCRVVSALVMQCLMPVVSLEEDFRTLVAESPGGGIINATGPGVAAIIGPNGKDRSDVYLGFVLDGLNTFRNFSELQPKLKMQFYSPPTASCRWGSVTIYNPDEDQSIEIKGSYLTLGYRQQDVRVSVGDGNCAVTQLNANQITCRPPRDKPDHENSSICGSDQLLVKVSIGFAKYDCSCLQYSSGSANIPLIYGLAIGLGGGLILALIIVTVTCCCRRKRQQKQTNKKPVKQKETNDDDVPSSGQYAKSLPQRGDSSSAESGRRSVAIV